MPDNSLNTKWPDALLESKRSVTDPVADSVIATIIESGFEEKVNDLFYSLVRNSGFDPIHFSTLPKEVSSVVINYFETTNRLPEWADMELIKKGEELFSMYGPEIALILNVKSLPLCYACSKGAKVLYMTGRLTERSGSVDQLARRLMETSQMIINALAPNGMMPNGDGIITIQKVRLIHASIRYYLQHPKYNPKGWDEALYGKPINQEDMAGTLMSFAPLVLSGLKQVDIHPDSDHVKGYMHAWKVIGYLMGIDNEFLPDTYEEGWNLGIAIMKHQAAASDHGKELTRACIDFLKTVLPGNVFDQLPEYMIWYFIQDISKAINIDLADALGVQDAHLLKDKIALAFTELFFVSLSKFETHSGAVRIMMETVNKKVLQGFLHYYNDGKNVRFYIPPSLQKDWKLYDVWKDEVVLSPTLFDRRLALQRKTDSLEKPNN